MTFTKEQLIAAAHGRIDFANMMLSDNPEPLKERTWSIELELARIALSALRERAEPVAWTEKCEITNMRATGLYLRGFPDSSQGRDIPLYTVPPAPVVPEEVLKSLDLLFRRSYFRRWVKDPQGYVAGSIPVRDLVNVALFAEACREAMLAAPGKDG
ncbi:hypothetical protein SNN61_002539 [Cronobacter sakazakii]|uniref:hypothetical protein n=1 Tax=Cronobacter sakazakii TaxID=28141 RepID=UPI002894A3A8|nr:hypothetical protein [Cronobacter sakazakii]EIZ9234929.1 hypothetical protein [Cronobacter sakazakii]ELY4093960.1 hypothetical protein [Cronobacter sakazakii]ELY4405973.1 hypothetical protein [Cronobacter sakazakii]ELY4465204.1 hypothetical protein [Cronobacter sakazakii]ELY5896798.1 hypothetical protein [Cronobacter sakazakii]